MTKDKLSQFETGVIKNQITQFLFKYRTIDSTLKLLGNNSLWFSSPKDFNDPFDCQIVPDITNTESEIRNFIKTNTIGILSEQEIDNLASKTHREPGRWKETIESIYKEIINKTGVCCFAKNETNLLMWSHYSNSHNGVCLKFDVLKDIDLFYYPCPVNYQNNYPVHNHLGDRETIIKDMILTKSLDWKYEDEIRVFKMGQAGLLSFKKEALVEIIFGCNTNKDDIEKIIATSKENNFNIIFKSAVKMKKQFGIEIIDL